MTSERLVRSGRTALPLVVLCALVAVWGAYLWCWDLSYNSDVAMIGLMARRIAAGLEQPIFVWTVGYQGMFLEGYLAAALFKLFGVSPLVLSLAPTIYALLFLAALFVAVRKYFDAVTAWLTLLLLVVSCPMFLGQFLRTLPNYPEMHLGGVIGILIFTKLAVRIANDHSPVNLRTLFLTLTLGLVHGFFYYTFSLSALFLAAIAAQAVLLALFKRPSPKATVLLLSPLYLVGFALGYSPALYYSYILIGPGSRPPQLGGDLAAVRYRWDLLMQVHHRFLNLTDSPAVNILLVSLFGVAVVWFSIQVTKAVWQGLRSRRSLQERTVGQGVLFFLPLAAVGAFLSSAQVGDLEHARWVISLVVIYALMTANLLITLWRQWPRGFGRLVPLVLLGLLLANNARSITGSLETSGDERRFLENLIATLDSHKLNRGYGTYWSTYVVNLMTDERIILQPVDTPYSPHYSVEVRGSDRLGYVNKPDPRLELPGGSINLDGFDYLVEDAKAVGKGLMFYALRRLDMRPVR